MALLDTGELRAEDIRAVLGKTEGNGCVNDFTRGYATFAYSAALAARLGITAQEVRERVAFVMSGGTEGVMSPHVTVFAMREVDATPAGQDKRLAIGVAFTRDFQPEELGRTAMVTETAAAVRRAMEQAGIDDPHDVHFVQVKTPLLTAERVADAHRRGHTVATEDTYKSMGYARGASALGVAVGLGELAADKITDAAILHDWSLYSSVASTSAGIELLNNEVIVMGNSASSASELVIGHAVMRDAIDAGAVRDALRQVGVELHDGEVPEQARERIVNVLSKAEADPTGQVRGRRHIMLDDSDINSTRHARAVVNGVIASVVGDPMVYVSGGAEHQGPAGGGPVAVIARIATGTDR
ncbi:ring-opening amidohydrolase [Dactylosporangium salmoneum]|uniref:Cyanuric acid amidohydrolase n=2 Tax=Dactylosporangium salmoneum TaxID=53361 RepID=A0ABP5TR35_9ACTN